MATGPLTNIAMMLRLRPELAARIPRLVVMGGGHGLGNATSSAEFNIWTDPEAAELGAPHIASLLPLPLPFGARPLHGIVLFSAEAHSDRGQCSLRGLGT